jgi:membrane-associated PAP2 superfamily phosphatase
VTDPGADVRSPSTFKVIMAVALPAALVTTILISLLVVASPGDVHLAADLRRGLGVSDNLAHTFAKAVINHRRREALMVSAASMLLLAWLAVWRRRHPLGLTFRLRSQRARLVIGIVLGVLGYSVVAAPCGSSRPS